MYSDAELDAAVKAGVLTAPAAAAFRDFVAELHGTPGPDEERFRLLTGFNDIFVTIAAALILLAIGWLGSRVQGAIGFAAVATASWGLAEYFTRRRRMALPSIVLLLAFTGSVLLALIVVLGADGERLANVGGPWRMAACAAGTGVAAYLHWRRFMVPISVAVGAAAGVATVLLLLIGVVPALLEKLMPLLFVAGLGMFVLAMWWDGSDPKRETRRADVAFWLHLAAAPLIVHPMFNDLALRDLNAPTPAHAALAVALYLVLALVALAVDRRALLVSALAYVLYAVAMLLRSSGSLTLSFALAALVIGCGLLLLSALWQRARRASMRLLPRDLRLLLPLD